MSWRTDRPLLALVVAFSLTATGLAQPDAAPDTAAADQRVFRAGAATSNITPPLGEPIVGGWEPSPATHIHDELFARCLVLDDGSTQVAIVLCDNVGIPREVFDAARSMIDEETDLPPEHVLLAATHTHSATTARGPSKMLATGPMSEYQKFLARRIADGVRRAINHLEPARIGWGTASEPRHVFNRRWHMRGEAEEELRNPFGGVDRIRMNPPRGHADLLRPAGPTDPEIAFLSVQSRDGRPIALLANYSLHYVGGVPGGHVSADYFGVFAERIRKLLQADGLDPPFVGILSNGTSGDVNNIDFRGPSERREPYEKMRIVAADVAAKVYAAHETIEFHDWVPLAAAHRDLTLAVRKPSPEQLEYLSGVGSRREGTRAFHSREQIYARRIALLRDAPDEVQIPLMALRIGDVGIAAIPFEVFAETGLEIKEKSPLPHTFTIELAGGSYGYLPTPEQHELGGYETWLGTNYVEKEASRKIVAALLEMFESLRD
jgi:neutral ceramidase